MLLTCLKCQGNKKYRGMGSMMTKCEPCDGTGIIDLQTESPKKSASVEVITKKSRKERIHAGEEEVKE